MTEEEKQKAAEEREKLIHRTWAREWLERTAHAVSIKKQAEDAFLIQQDKANRLTASYKERAGSGGAETAQARQEEAWIEASEKESIMLKLAAECGEQQRETDLAIYKLPRCKEQAYLIAKYSAHKGINACMREFNCSKSQWLRNLDAAHDIFYLHHEKMINDWIAYKNAE